MKSIYKTIVLGMCALGTAACDDFLEQTSPSEQTATTVFNSVTYTQQALNKVYSGLTLDHTYGCRIPLNLSLNSDIELIDGLDASAVIAVSERGAGNYNASPTWTKLDDNWKNMFAMIENANIVIEGIEGSSLMATEGSTRNTMLRYKGEALGLRAMLYADLVKLYGDVPGKFETTAVDGSNLDMGKTDRDEIYERLLADLDEAIECLPWAGENNYSTEHITKGFAHGLYARIALAYAGYSIRESAKDGYETLAGSDGTYPVQRPSAAKRAELYRAALSHLDCLIASGIHKLNPSFDNEWTLINQKTLDNTYRENIYEVAHGMNFSGEMGYTIGVRLNGVTSTYGYGNSSGKVKLTAPFFMSFDPKDQRRDLTCATYEIKPGDDNSAVETMQSNTPFGIYVAKWDVRKMGQEWLAANKNATTKWGYGVNWVVMRYSDVLLMYAEVLNELEGADATGPTCGLTAREALRMVRSRAFDASAQADVDAYVASIASGSDFFDAIVNERAWELAGEALRKFDLVRWGLLDAKINQFKSDYLALTQTALQKLYYKMSSEDVNKIDMSSICWYEEPSDPDAYKSTTFWGSKIDDKGTDSNEKNIGYLDNISSGLNSTVFYRHLLPIGSVTISDAGGSMSNSYGY